MLDEMVTARQVDKLNNAFVCYPVARTQRQDGGEDTDKFYLPHHGESILEHVAGVEDYQVALATFRAACERWPNPRAKRQDGCARRDGRSLVSAPPG
jgi:hypothetical protein